VIDSSTTSPAERVPGRSAFGSSRPMTKLWLGLSPAFASQAAADAEASTRIWMEAANIRMFFLGCLCQARTAFGRK
jgi:hypothetical protein